MGYGRSERSRGFDSRRMHGFVCACENDYRHLTPSFRMRGGGISTLPHMALMSAVTIFLYDTNKEGI